MLRIENDWTIWSSLEKSLGREWKSFTKYYALGDAKFNVTKILLNKFHLVTFQSSKVALFKPEIVNVLRIQFNSYRRCNSCELKKVKGL